MALNASHELFHVRNVKHLARLLRVRNDPIQRNLLARSFHTGGRLRCSAQ